MKFGTQDFSRSLITNLKLDIQNSEWRIQYGGRQIDNSINFYDILYSGVFGVAEYQSEIIFSKFQMPDPIWRMWNQKFHEININEYFESTNLKLFHSKISKKLDSK